MTASDSAKAAAELAGGLEPRDAQAIARALDLVASIYAERTLGTGEDALAHARGTASHLSRMRLDGATRIAGLLFAVPDFLADYRTKLVAAFGEEVASIVDSIARLHRLRLVTREAANQRLTAARMSAKTSQAEVLRKMLLAMVEDIRAVVVRLASRTQTLGYLLESGDAGSAATIARETFDIYAPLANRLGMWQLKSELEDGAFRLTDPQAYRRIAAFLAERRSEREAFIERCMQTLRGELAAAGIPAELSGRPKHAYSIHSKLRAKGRALESLYDLHAVRVVVTSERECYTALGIAHDLWQPIANELDDYIARPKPNGYRSLHTAVEGPDGRPLEIQIRTQEMHREAELGVASHWRYKEGGGVQREASYEQKIAWLRRVLAWRDEIVDGADWVDQTKRAALDDTVYVLTPQGRVIDLPSGSTAVDFAYHVHTELGHRCRGAKVDGVMVPLDTPLASGQRVEVVTVKQGGPSRDWLNPALGYLRSSRARTKVRQWFNAVEQQEMAGAGRAAVERELQREGETNANLEALARRLGYQSTEEMFIAVAREEVGPRQLQTAIRGGSAPALAPTVAPITRESRAERAPSGILVVGVDRLMTQLARCCRPAPPDPIRGFVTRGRGVSIHRQGCKSLAALARAHGERLIDAEWGKTTSGVFAIDLLVQAHDRQGLLRDISEVFTRERINVVAVNTQTRARIATMQFTVELAEVGMLQRALDGIQDVPGVFLATRK